MLIVQKFGGSSLADRERMLAAAELIAGERAAGHSVVAVLSAQGDTTDALLRLSGEYGDASPARETDALLATGEQTSTALMAIALHARGVPAVSLSGWQMGLHTDGVHGAARIRSVAARRLRRELAEGRVVLAAGFQGVDDSGDVTTLGRGGSDTTAVALAAALRADRCRIYTDVPGVFTADPRRVPEARRLDTVTFEEMLALSSLGAQVLAERSVQLARRYEVELEVLSAAERGPGTLVRAPLTGERRPPLVGIGAAPGQGEALRISVVGRGADGKVLDRMCRAAAAAGSPPVSAELLPLAAGITVAGDRGEALLRELHQQLFPAG